MKCPTQLPCCDRSRPQSFTWWNKSRSLRYLQSPAVLILGAPRPQGWNHLSCDKWCVWYCLMYQWWFCEHLPICCEWNCLEHLGPGVSANLGASSAPSWKWHHKPKHPVMGLSCGFLLVKQGWRWWNFLNAILWLLRHLAEAFLVCCNVKLGQNAAPQTEGIFWPVLPPPKWCFNI